MCATAMLRTHLVACVQVLPAHIGGRLPPCLAGCLIVLAVLVLTDVTNIATLETCTHGGSAEDRACHPRERRTLMEPCGTRATCGLPLLAGAGLEVLPGLEFVRHVRGFLAKIERPLRARAENTNAHRESTGNHKEAATATDTARVQP